MKGGVLVAASLGALAVGAVLGWSSVGGDRGPEEGQPLPAKSEGRAPEAKGVGPNATVQRIVAMEDPLGQVRAMLELARELPEEELLEWFEERHYDTGDDLLDRLFRSILEERLLAADPRGMVTKAPYLLSTWVRHDPSAAEEFLLGMEDPKKILKQAGSVLYTLARIDPVRAIDLMEKLHGVGKNSSTVAHYALREVAMADPKRLLEAVEKWPEAWKKAAQEAGAAAWLGVELEEAMAWMEQRNYGPKFLEAAINRDSGQSLDLSGTFGQLPEEWREALLGSRGFVARALVRKNPEGWLAADAESLGVTEEQLLSLQRQALRADPNRTREEAAALLATLRPELWEDVVKDIVTRWGRFDPDGTEAWIAELAAPELREFAQTNLPPPAAPRRTTVERMPPEELFGDFLDGNLAASHLSSRQWRPEDATAFRSLPEEERRRAAERIVETSWSLPTWLKAEALRVTVEASGDERMTRRFVGVVESWGRTEPRRAAEWVLDLEAGDTRDLMLRNVAATWAGYDPGEVRRWAESLENEAVRGVVLEAVEE